MPPVDSIPTILEIRAEFANSPLSADFCGGISITDKHAQFASKMRRFAIGALRGNQRRFLSIGGYRTAAKETIMGRAVLLWLLGVPIPVILVLFLIFHH